MALRTVVILLLVVASLPARAQLPLVAPDTAGMDGRRLARIDDAVEGALAAGRMPGCVVCVGRRGCVVWLEAYGARCVEPVREPMRVDTVFDLASLTKPIATATSVMMLVERGQVRLGDRVAGRLPEFGVNGKERVTVTDLLLHRGGLIADNALSDYDDGPGEAWRRICALELEAEPGEQFIYSDVGFIVLGELVRRLTGLPLDEFAGRELFMPLGMRETGFRPAASLQRRASPTERRGGRWMRGEVHDPRAARLGGVAGHAGLFSTASDLAVFASVLLGDGSLDDRSVLSPRGVAVMTEAHEVPGGGARALGWDRRSIYSSNRGELLSDQAFGHGGFTGTSLWIDPELDLFIIFLSNRVHPDGKGLVNPLAGAIGSIAAASVAGPVERGGGSTTTAAGRVIESREVRTGIDVLEREGFDGLRGRRVGLITNRTGVNRRGERTIDVMHDAGAVELIALLSPEHGLEASVDQPDVPDGRDEATGLPVFSLYSPSRRPARAQLEGLDTLVLDIQDVGTRFYTYISTMTLAMESAAEHGLRFVVLDRPNPINGRDVEGPVLEAGRESFTGIHAIAVRHGMTVGELARLVAAERELPLDLEVVRMEGWRRAEWFDATGLWWIDPSPNMRSVTGALLYPGIGLLEMTNLSVGRGTDRPFERVGAPWIDAMALASAMNAAGLAGVRFLPASFTPHASVHAGEACRGIEMVVTDRERLHPVRMGLTLAMHLRRLHRRDWDVTKLDRLLVHEATCAAILAGRPMDEIEAAGREELEEFKRRRARYLLYE